MLRLSIHSRRWAAMLGIAAWISMSLVPGQNLLAAAQGGGDPAVALPEVVPHDFAGDVRALPQVPSEPKYELELRQPQASRPFISGQEIPSSDVTIASMPAPSHSFAGLSFAASCTGGQCGAGWPPDTNGDVGPQHYIQSVNSAFAIYSKSGSKLAAFTENSLWAPSGVGGARCNGNSQGDPVVIYDAQANRWILTNFAFSVDSFGNPLAPFYECIAVSKTGNPVTGGWRLYAVRIDTGAAGQPPHGVLGDYPKFGIWTDCLYMAANGFNLAGNYVGGMFASFSKADLYAGNPLTAALGFRSSSSDYYTMIPSNLSAPGTTGLPPAHTPNYFVQESLTTFAFKVRKFTAGADCGGGGVLGAPVSVSQQTYSYPGTSTSDNIVPQPGTSIKLDTVGDRLMQKVQYRRVGSVESLWVTHTFRASSTGPTGQQWAQIKVTGGTITTTPVQQQRFNPGDGRYRWMGSIAADRKGNVALAYSISGASGTNFPSIAYAGRLVTDPLNQLSQGERKLVSGLGSQKNNCGGAPCHRWGDYSSMSVDPVDGCTFWFTNEYYVSAAAGNSGTWATRIGSFKFPNCP